MRARWLPELVNQYKFSKYKSPFSKHSPYRLYNTKILVNYLNPKIEVLDVIDDDSYKQTTAMAVLKCNCGNIYKTQLSQLDNPTIKLTCSCCSHKSHGKQSSLKHLKERLNTIEKAGFKLIDTVDETIRIHDKILLETKEGYRVRMSYMGLNQGYKNNCYKNTNIFSVKYNKENIIYNINIFCKNNDIKTKAIEFSKINAKNTSAKTYIKCQCECGNYFDTALYEFVCYGKTKCNECNKNKSKWCTKVEEFLNENNLKFSKEVILKECRDRHPLPFDYKLDINNGFIEVDGEQHFYESGYGIGMTKEEMTENFTKRKYHDLLKDKFCKENGYKLLRISYKDVLKGTYKEKILNFIKED